jgi:hypothetical protein
MVFRFRADVDAAIRESVVLKNRWHQLQIEDRNMEFMGLSLAGLIFGRSEVIEVFDQRDAPSDEAADAAVGRRGGGRGGGSS